MSNEPRPQTAAEALEDVNVEAHKLFTEIAKALWIDRFTRWLRERKARRVYLEIILGWPWPKEGHYEFHGSQSEFATLFARRASGLSEWEPK